MLLKVLQCGNHADDTKQYRKAKGHNLKQARAEVNHSSHFVALSTDPKFQGIEVFPLISSRGSETLTVGIGVFPLIVIRGSFIVFPLVVLLFVMRVLYCSYRHLSSVLSSYSGKNLKVFYPHDPTLVMMLLSLISTVTPSQFSMQLNSNSLEQEEETFMPMMLISFSNELKISFPVVNIVLIPLFVLLFLIRVL